MEDEDDETLASVPARFDAFFEILDELESESDRGVAVLGLSLLDHRIQELLLHLLVPIKESKDIVKRAPFANRLTLALSIGLISRTEFDECNRLRQIRNDFAHLFEHQFSFTAQNVASRCRQLRLYFFTNDEHPEEVEEDEEMPTDEQLDGLVLKASPRQRFIRSVAQVYVNWIIREFHTQHRRMQPSGLDDIEQA